MPQSDYQHPDRRSKFPARFSGESSSQQGGILTEYGRLDEFPERFQGAVRICGRRHCQLHQPLQLESYSRINEDDWSLAVCNLTGKIGLSSGRRRSDPKKKRASGYTIAEAVREFCKRHNMGDRALPAGKKERKFLP